MEKFYDDYISYLMKKSCYKYIHKCSHCGEILVEISGFEYNNIPERAKIPNYCFKCGSMQNS